VIVFQRGDLNAIATILGSPDYLKAVRKQLRKVRHGVAETRLRAASGVKSQSSILLKNQDF
jgi:hypothetical protein